MRPSSTRRCTENLETIAAGEIRPRVASYPFPPGRVICAFLVLLLPHRSLVAAAAEAPASTTAPAPVAGEPVPPPPFTDIVLTFAATDGTALEAKLSIPAGATAPVPVVYHLHGAGPRNFDHAMRYVDADGKRKTGRFYDYYAHEVTRRGLAFFRMSKRGCTAEIPSGRPLVDRPVFSTATPTVLLDDYTRGLEALRQRPEIDARKIILSGASEGTRLGPELALRSPEGIIGLALAGYAADNAHDIVVWQNTVGPWRNMIKRIPAAADGVLTKEEHTTAAAIEPQLATTLPFASIDTNADGIVNEAEFAGLTRPRLDAILKAVEERNDELIWQAVVNLTSAYLLEGWDGPPNHATLVKIDLPIAIYHGDLDGACRVEGVQETAAAFRAAGKTNLAVHLYEGHDHDLNWTWQTSKNGGPRPYQEAFDFMAGLARPAKGD